MPQLPPKQRFLHLGLGQQLRGKLDVCFPILLLLCFSSLPRSCTRCYMKVNLEQTSCDRNMRMTQSLLQPLQRESHPQRIAALDHKVSQMIPIKFQSALDCFTAGGEKSSCHVEVPNGLFTFVHSFLEPHLYQLPKPDSVTEAMPLSTKEPETARIGCS